jgi:hypothetical protein
MERIDLHITKRPTETRIYTAVLGVSSRPFAHNTCAGQRIATFQG